MSCSKPESGSVTTTGQGLTTDQKQIPQHQQRETVWDPDIYQNQLACHPSYSCIVMPCTCQQATSKGCCDVSFQKGRVADTQKCKGPAVTSHQEAAHHDGAKHLAERPHEQAEHLEGFRPTAMISEQH